MSENWREVTDAEAFFGQAKRRADIERRRPVIRRASDLVGPGIGSSAVRVNDWNDPLAMFNGYYTSTPGALNAPDAAKALAERESFVGFTVMDTVLGGKQFLTGLTTRVEYTRVFLRNPGNLNTILWAEWVPSLSVASSVEAIKAAFNKASYAMTPKDASIGGSGTLEVRMGSVYLSGTAIFNGTVEATNTPIEVGSIQTDDAPANGLQVSVPLSGAGAGGKPGMLDIRSNGLIFFTPSYNCSSLRLGGSWPHKTLGK